MDLDGDGIELKSVSNSTTHFDFDGDGFSETVGWVAPDDGFLVLDRNVSGSIDSTELFGNEIVDGYTALQELDTNADGRIDAADLKFDQLQIWRDLNGNGASDAGELSSLTSLGIASISLDKVQNGQLVAGNEVAFSGHFTRADGSTGATGAVFFQADRTLTLWNPPPGFEVDDEANLLSQLKGYGNLPDLNYAMTLNADLKETVKQLSLDAASMNRQELKLAFEALLFKWAGVEEVISGDRGQYVDATHLAFLEKFFGSPITQQTANGPSEIPTARFGQMLEKSFAEISGALLVRFLSEVPLTVYIFGGGIEPAIASPFLPLIHLQFDSEQDGFAGEKELAITGVLAGTPDDSRSALEYLDKFVYVLSGLTLEFYGNEPARFVADLQLNIAEWPDRAAAAYVVALARDGSSLNGGSEVDETLAGSAAADILAGYEGDDLLLGKGGDDSYVYVRGDGNDVIEENSSEGTDELLLIGVASTHVTLERNSNDVRLVVAESAAGVGDGGSIILKGALDNWFSRGVERIIFSDGVAWTQASLRLMLLDQASTVGDDTIVGFNVDDIIRGETGDDIMTGGAGDDTYLYARGDGNDVIVEGTSGNFSTIDSLILEGINPADVSLVRNGNDVTVVVAESAPGEGDGGSVLLKDGFDDWFSQGVEKVVFADGTIWTQVAIREMLIASAGTAGNDIILGSGASDVIVGGEGDDALNGGAGDDTYVYTRGDGDDVITEGTVGNFSSYDTLILHGVTPADVQLVRDGNSVTLTIAESSVGAGDAGSIRIVDGLDGWFYRGVEEIVFDNGTVWTQADMRAALLVQAATAGDDLILGFPGNDVITGGHGDDIIVGGGGSDTYVYASGDGKDVIDNQSSAGPNKLVLHGIAVADVTVVRNAGNAILLFGVGGIDGRVTVKEQFGSGGKITSVEFDDGTVWTDQTILANAVANDGSIVTHYGTTGVDDIVGTVENDVIDGRGGADILRGGNGNDTYHFAQGSGDDAIVEGSASAGSGDLIKLAGLNASDVELTRLGNDLFLKILASGETLKVNDQFNGDIGVEQISFADNTVWDRSQIQAASWVRGTMGDDTISGGGGDENIDGGAGNDTLYGGVGSDTYLFGVGSGNDTIGEAWYNSGSDAIRLKDLLPADVQFGQEGDDLVILIISSGEQLRVTNQFNGSAVYGIEQIQFSDDSTWDRSQIVAASWMLGTSGDDTINGTGGDDKIDGGAGNDTMSGNSGSDTYAFGLGSGNDTISEAWHGGGTDVVKLRNLLPSDVLFTQEGGDLVIRIIFSGEQLRIANQLDTSAPYGVEQITFADNTTWDRSQIAEASWVYGTSGNDTITGGGGNDKIDGGAGSDTLAGRGGGDTYLYGGGSGNDTINEVWYDGGTDTVKLAGLLPADLRFTQVSSDLVIEIVSTGEQLKITDQAGGGGIEQVVFADNTSWSRAQIQAATWIRGTSGSDTIAGGYNADQIDGGGGNDTLAGGAGGDTYLFAAGSGNDTITEYGYDGTTDIVKLAGLVVSDVAFSRVANDLVIQIITSGETLTISNQYSPGGNAGIEQIAFADQTYHSPTSMTLSGNTVAENSDNGTVVGTVAGVDPDSADTLGYVLIDSAEGRFSINATTGVISVANGLLINYETATSYNVTVRLTDQTGLKFDQTLSINVTDVYEDSNIVWLYGTAGNETIYGSSVAEMIDGKAGDDNLRGGNGGDTYVYGLGSGNDTVSESSIDVGTDVIQLTGLNASDVEFSRGGTDLFIKINSSGEILKVENQFNGSNGIEQVTFADGSSWNRSQIADAAWVRGTAGGETLYGTADSETFDGRGGNDNLRGAAGDDTYLFGVGSGHDTISESSADAGADIVRLVGLNSSDVEFSRGGTDLYIKINSSSEYLKVDSQFNGTNGIEQVTLADGSSWNRSQIADAAWVRGTAGGETLYGTSDSETFDGRGGNDNLRGAAGDDTYLFGVGSGHDTIVESSADTGADIVKLVGLNSSDVEFSRGGTDLYIKTNSSSEYLKVESQFNGTNGIEQVTFADGSSWNRSQIADAAWVRGTAGGETLYGTADSETFDGRGGNDSLRGAAGDDTYLFGVGSGHDTITESSADPGADIVKLVGLNSSDVEFSRGGTDLYIKTNASSEYLKVENQFNGSNGIEQVAFADGSIWNRSQIADAAWVRGTAGGETLYGTSDSETFDGRGGNDDLRGAAGGDTFLFGVGSGHDTITESSADAGTDIIKLVGLNSSNVVFGRTGSDLLIQIVSSGETLRVASQFDGTNGIEQVLFADNTTWDRTQIAQAAWFRGTSGVDSVIGSASDDFLAGGLGNDYLRGNDGNDTYVYASGDGNDTVDDESGSTSQIDTLKFTNLNASDLTISRAGGDLIVNVNASGETVRVAYQFYSQTNNWGIEKFEFADGSSWDFQTINANAWYRGTSGNDSITASSWNETLAGGLGNDYLRGNDGDDTYVYASGDGNDTIDDQSGSTTQIDTLKLTNLNEGDVTVSRVGGDLMINVNATGESIKVSYQFYSPSYNYGIEKLEFANGSSWDLQTINANGWYRGTSGNDSITASSWNETLAGGLGNDYLRGNDGDDTYVYTSDDGNDTIDDQSGSTTQIDTLKFTNLNASDLTVSRVGVDLTINVNATGETIKLAYQFYSQGNNYGIEKFEFADGSSWNIQTINANAWTRGTAGNDTISGTSWNDSIAGGAGNDALSGAGGNDTFIFRANLGQDIVTDFAAGQDVLEFGDGIFADAAAALGAATASGNDTIITIDSSNSVLLQNVALANLQVGDFHIV